MKPGDDGVFPSVIFHNGRYEYGTIRKLALSADDKPVFCKIGDAQSVEDAQRQLQKLGWEFDDSVLGAATGPYRNIPIVQGSKIK